MPAVALPVTTGLDRSDRRRIRVALGVGYAPTLAVLGAVAVATAAEAPLDWVLPAAASAALVTAASAWVMLGLLRRAATRQSPVDSAPDRQAVAQAAEAHVEIDHRVRNTLQVVASLLSLELRRAGPASERAALLRVEARLHGLSLVHRGASAVDVSAPVRLDGLAAAIADHLFSEGRHWGPMPEVHMALDPVSGPRGQAAAFALFVTEALMHARDRHDPARREVPVDLSLKACPEGAWVLSVRAATDGLAEQDALSASLMANCAAQLGATLSSGRIGDCHEARLAKVPYQQP
jgi:two-component sensor histidine kinase